MNACMSLGAVSALLFACACAGDPPPARGATVVPVGAADGLTQSARCASAVRRVAAESFDCDEEAIELHPVGPGAFLSSGCGGSRTWLCDPDTGRPRW